MVGRMLMQQLLPLLTTRRYHHLDNIRSKVKSSQTFKCFKCWANKIQPPSRILTFTCSRDNLNRKIYH